VEMKVFDDFAQGKKEIYLADHLLNVTYKLLGDYKIIISVVRHVCEAAFLGINSFLEYEQFVKNRTSIPEDTGLRVRVFIKEYAQTLGLTKEDSGMLLALTELQNIGAEATHYVQKGNNFYVMSGGFNLARIDVSTLRAYIKQTSHLITDLEKHVHNDRTENKV